MVASLASTLTPGVATMCTMRSRPSTPDHTGSIEYANRASAPLRSIFSTQLSSVSVAPRAPRSSRISPMPDRADADATVRASAGSATRFT